MIIAVTGATGVLGSALVDEFLVRGHEVRALTRQSPQERDGVQFCEGTLEDVEVLDRFVIGADAIVHAAYQDMDAPLPPGRSMAEHFVQNNIAGTIRLIERTPATTRNQLVFVSSLAVYGSDPRRLPGADRLPLDEDFPVWPGEFYGGHKAALEKMVIAGSGDPGLNTCVFRPGFVLGAYPDASRDYVCKIVDEALEHGQIRSQLGCYVAAASDLSRLIADAIGDDAVKGKVYNTFDRWLDFRDLAPILESATGRSIEVTAPVATAPGIENARLAERSPRWETDRVLEELVRARAGSAG